MHNKQRHNRPQKTRAGLAVARLCFGRYAEDHAQKMKFLMFLLLFPHFTFALDINCGDKLENANSHIKIDYSEVYSEGEFRIVIDVDGSHKAKELKYVLYKSKDRFSLAVPLQLKQIEEKYQTWLIGTIENLNGYLIEAYYGENCPIILQHKISITRP